MELLMFIFVAAVAVSDGLIVHGPSGPLVVPLGSTVVLPCYVDEPLLMEGLEVEWRRIDSETLVHLYQDGESRPEAQQQDYLDRAHFFTDQIQHGNFSLLLDNLRTEDEVKYTCRVYSQQDHGETEVEIKIVERLLVSGLSRPISATVGDDVTLNCSVDSHITTEHIKEVSWRKTDEDDILVLLYRDNEALSSERYRDRVEFFTDEIPKGNFSLRLKNVGTRDKGVYMCQVFAGSLSASATAELERLGLSVSHTMVLILCISASGSALLLCCLIYCRSTTKGLIVQNSYKSEVNLGDSVVLPCHVRQKLLTKGLKVEWRRTRRISKTLVHLYQDGKSRAEKQDKDFKDRAHFFTNPIKHGNFSLRLDNLRAEDEGKYTCRVYSKRICVFSNTTHLVYRKQDRVQSTNAELKLGFIVKHHYTPVPLGSSVVLPFYSDKPFEVEGLQVDWRRKGKALILYQDGESRPEAQQEDYLDRAHFFTDQIQHGNFSLRLDNLRAEDEGQYTCRVYRHYSWNDLFAAKINLVMKLLDTVFRLQMCLVFFPNILMFLAFVFWGVSEGSVNEPVSCCALYFLRPLLILWAAPYINEFTDKIKTWILNYSYVAEYVVFSIIVYSALFTTAWQKLLNIAVFDRVVIIVLFSVLFSIVFLCCLCKIIYLTQIGKKRGQTIEIFDLVADMMFDILPTLQFILLFYMFGSFGAGLIIVVILPVLLMMTDDRWFNRCRCGLSCSPSVTRTVMLIFILVIKAVMIIFYIMTMEKTTDPVGWGCVMVYLQIHWAVIKFTDPYYLISFSQNFHRFVPVYVFGSVGFILLTSTALTTELILKTVNGDRTVGDLRFIVFPFECFFAVSLLLSGLFASKITNCMQSCQKQNTAETQQIKYTKAEDEDSVVLKALENCYS